MSKLETERAYLSLPVRAPHAHRLCLVAFDLRGVLEMKRVYIGELHTFFDTTCETSGLAASVLWALPLDDLCSWWCADDVNVAARCLVGCGVVLRRHIMLMIGDGAKGKGRKVRVGRRE
jgi:hypothetical protein